MQKKLIAVAVAGLGLSGAALAQSNVTVYGIMNLSYGMADNGDTATTQGIRVSKVSSHSSRLGFKGTEDLGNGLKAIFQIESSINGDNSAAGTLNGRNTFVGLQGDWGTVQMGAFDSPYKTSTRGLDVFGDQWGDNRNLMGGIAAKSSTIAFDGRPANVVAYMSPTLNGFNVNAAYIAGAEAATLNTQDKGSAYSLSATYSNGPWYAALAYERHNMGTPATGTIVGVAAQTDRNEHATKLGIGYKTSDFRLGLAYETTNDDFNAATTRAHKAWSLAGGYTFGLNEIKAAYTKANDLDGTSNTGAKQWAVGLDHKLSKRTTAYVDYVKLTNESAASYGITGGGSTNSTAVGAGADPSVFSLGIKHTF